MHEEYEFCEERTLWMQWKFRMEKALKLHFNNSNTTRKMKFKTTLKLLTYIQQKIVYAPMSLKNINVCNEIQKENEVIHEWNNWKKNLIKT